MDVERTIEFILEMHAKTEAVLADMTIKGQATDRRLDRLERNLTRLARLGLRARSRLNEADEQLKRRAEEHEKWMAEQRLLMAEIDEKLNVLIDVVDRLPKTPPA